MTTSISAGTVTVANGGTTVTGTDTFWIGKVFEGDLFTDPAQGIFARVTADATSNTALSINAWPGTALVDAAYEVILQSDSIRMSERTRQLLEALSLVEPNYDAQVADLPARGAYDDELGPSGGDRGFAVLVSNVGDGRAAIYSKLSNDSGDWSAPAYVTGPVGPEFDVTAGPTSTLAPDQPATVTPVPFPGGVRLDFAIPRGPTGDINGVTPFWITRLGADADAAAARAGLNAQATLGFTPVNRAGDTMFGPLNVIAGQWFDWRLPASGGAFGYVTKNNGAVLGLVGVDGGAVVSGGTGNGFGIRSEEEIFLASGGNSRRFRLTANGEMLLSSQPAFHATYGGAGGQTSGAIIFGNQTVNRGSHYNTANGRFVAPVAGVYAFDAGVFFDMASSATANAAFQFARNGIAVAPSIIATYGTAKQYERTTGSILMSLAAGDYVSIVITVAAGGASLSGTATSNFAGRLLG